MINFPSSPSVDDVYQFNGSVYRWTGTHWAANNLPSSLGGLVNVTGDAVTGDISATTVNGLTWPTSDGNANDTLTTNGSGVLSFTEPSFLHTITDVTIPSNSTSVDVENLPGNARVLKFDWTNLATVDDYIGTHPVILLNKEELSLAQQQQVGVYFTPTSEFIRSQPSGIRLESGFSDVGSTGQGTASLLWDDTHTVCFVSTAMTCGNNNAMLRSCGWIEISSVTSVSFYTEYQNWASGSIRISAAY